MGFVRTEKEIAKIDEALAYKILQGQFITVSFRSTPEMIQHVLPPGLSPTSDPIVVTQIKRYQTSYCGSFAMAGMYLGAQHEGTEGTYILANYIDTVDSALVIGREEFGEPKKMGDVEMFRGRDNCHAWVERHGVKIMELLVSELSAPRDAGVVSSGTLFSAKASLAAEGPGLQDDAYLLRVDAETETWLRREGKGSISLQGTVHDPLDDFPILEIVAAEYSEGELRTKDIPKVLGRIPADEYVPYHYGRLDDWSALNTLT